MTLDEVSELNQHGGLSDASVEFDPFSLEWVVDICDRNGTRHALTDARGARVGFVDDASAAATLATHLNCPIHCSGQQRRFD